MQKRLGVILLLFLIGTIAGCSSTQEVISPSLNAFQSPLSLPTYPLYILSDRPATGQPLSTLSVIDPISWQTIQVAGLPQSAQPNELYRDPLGRVWVTAHLRCELLACYFIDYRLRIFSADGRLLHWMPPPCTVHNLVFTDKRAIIVCERDQLIILNLTTLATDSVVNLGKPKEVYFLETSAANKEHLLVAGTLSTLPSNYTPLITLLDLHDFQIEAQLKLEDPVYFAQALIYQERFYLLNAGSKHALGEPNNDIVVVDPQFFDTLAYLISSEAAPSRAQFVGDDLYLLHDRPHEDPNTLRERIVSRLNLQTGKTEKWVIPGYRQWSDFAVIQQQIVLVNNHDLYDFPIPNPPEFMSGGLYELNRVNGQVHQLLTLGHAMRILVYP
jgi:hypothetical protein